MLKIAKFLLALTIFLSASLMAAEGKNVLVKGEGVYIHHNAFSNGFHANLTRIDLKANKHKVKGIIRVSSTAAGPVDPVTGIDYEVKAIIDAVRVFSEHPNVVWIHGIVKNGFITYGSDQRYGELAEKSTLLNQVNGEFIGAITPWGRTNFLTKLENGGSLPDFLNASEDTLTSLVGGKSRLLINEGEKSSFIFKTTKHAFKVPN